MSIKSQRNTIDLKNMTNKRQRQPNNIANNSSLYKSHNKDKYGQIDTTTDYVKENLKKTVKPRGGEYR